MENSAAAGPRGKRLAMDPSPGRERRLCGARKGSNGFRISSGLLSYFDSLFLTFCIYKVVHNEYMLL